MMAVFVGGAANLKPKHTVEITSANGVRGAYVTINGVKLDLSNTSMAGTKWQVRDGGVVSFDIFNGRIYVNDALVATGGDGYCYYDYVVSCDIKMACQDSLVYITEL